MRTCRAVCDRDEAGPSPLARNSAAYAEGGHGEGPHPAVAPRCPGRGLMRTCRAVCDRDEAGPVAHALSTNISGPRPCRCRYAVPPPSSRPAAAGKQGEGGPRGVRHRRPGASRTGDSDLLRCRRNPLRRCGGRSRWQSPRARPRALGLPNTSHTCLLTAQRSPLMRSRWNCETVRK